MERILIATANRGKQHETGEYLAAHGLAMDTPQGLGLELDPKETGHTLEENAVQKAEAYRVAAPGHIVLADDTGVEIDALDGEPGIHVRRWQDGHTRMEDEEIITYCIERMRGVPKAERGAQFRTVIAVAEPGQAPVTVEGTLRGHIVEQPIPQRFADFPFESLFYVDEKECILADIHQMSVEQQQGFQTHRQKALQAAIDYLREKDG